MDLMDFTTAQARGFLALSIGRADGEDFNALKVHEASKGSSHFQAYWAGFVKDSPLHLSKLMVCGILNTQSALEKIKNSCSHEEILDFVADCVAIVLADIEVHEKKKAKFQKYASFLEINYNDAVNRWKSRNNA
jgi:hypothetical protein